MQDRNIPSHGAPFSLPVEVSHLTKSFGSFTALDDVSFSIAQGETVALLGRNGAGKSTLIGCLMGFLLADSGNIDIFGHSIASLPREIRARTGFVPQTMTGFGTFRVAQLMDYIAAFYGELPPVDPALMAWADLDPRKMVRSLSGGQKQRLAIVLAMRHNPEFLVLDEPVASLDPHARRDFMNLLDSYTQRTGASILISSHILSDLERLCSRLLFVRQGRVVLDVPTETFRATTRWLEHPTPDQVLAALPADIQILGQRPDALLVHGWTEDLALPDGIQTVVPDFEDAFLEITAPRTTPAEAETPNAAA
ncbi:ABC transporter ATP-binding protein [Gluconobacter roseus]|uniref:ABC transporter n=1 Tax=Gluconobacter roseus NBRC 3990 TaxID=1307950 RepID=A0A4Y3M7K6_9PROT|nr:ABC transporter ATP-binding protein [Gluconobacter roseus]KXV42934.1 ABC transporter ATP-binding protein [Gluconobacter roseus]GBR48670.1 ABC transporter ATP-binding protein [Gluconobacter roseus NBRC 3990]GEB04427.1 ABC transporter [Gluconobacter roseus NBRC 3990]GLP92869.1 ABC transporter [Gluconobacter roseus NBRC 3990]